MQARGAPAHVRVPDEEVQDHLARLLASKTFQQVDRLKRFVRFITGEVLAGRGPELKEYVIGVQVFGRDTSFDPRTDPIVRVQARRLRARLERYYREEGHADSVVIELPKGGYAPTFRRREGAAPARASLGEAMAGRNTISVRPHVDCSASGSLGGFCRGLTDALVHALVQATRLRVLAPRHDEGHGAPAPEAGGLIVEGSVRVAQGRAHVTTHLTDGWSGQVLWSSADDMPLADGLDGQERVAAALVERLKPGLLDAGGASARGTENLAARNLCLQGRYHLNQRTEDGLLKAVEFFERAVVEDTQYSLAYSGLADAYGLLAHYGVLGPADVWARAASSAASAVMLDGLSAEAHTSLAHVHATQDWDWPGAEREFLHAIRLNARYSTAHHWYAMSCLVPMGRLDTALEHMQTAQALDPVSSIISRDVAVIHLYRRDLDAALDQCDHTVELNPHFAPAYVTLGLVQEQRNDFDESVAAFRRAADLAPHSPRTHSALARTYALSGRADQARDALATLQALAGSRYVSPFEFGLVYLALGQTEEGFRWLTRACDDRCFELLALAVDPRFDDVRRSQELTAIVSKLRLTAPAGRARA
ncbi:MAG: tetratricopeptide repeat protein [Acidobacteria bacterium]|nr:tetratricopeptide repeat protein [Acidobacteriota bacterium]